MCRRFAAASQAEPLGQYSKIVCSRGRIVLLLPGGNRPLWHSAQATTQHSLYAFQLAELRLGIRANGGNPPALLYPPSFPYAALCIKAFLPRYLARAASSCCLELARECRIRYAAPVVPLWSRHPSGMRFAPCLPTGWWVLRLEADAKNNRIHSLPRLAKSQSNGTPPSAK